MAMKLQISEILAKLKEFTGEGAVTKKVEWLKKHDSPTLRLLLQHNFDTNIAYNLPEGAPPFKRNENEIDQTESSLYSETRKLSYLWLQPSDSALDSLSKTQKEQLSELETTQAEMGKKLQEKIAEYRETEKEIEDAKDAIEQAKLRLKRAIENSQRVMKEGQVLNAQVQQVDVTVRNAQNTMLNANAELMGRAAPQNDRNVPKYRLEMQFVQLLESVHPDEADVLLAVKDKTLQKKYPVTKDIVKKAFPELLTT